MSKQWLSVEREEFAALSQEDGVRAMLSAMAMVLALAGEAERREVITREKLWGIGFSLAAVAVNAEEIDRASYGEVYDMAERAFRDLWEAHTDSMKIRAARGL